MWSLLRMVGSGAVEAAAGVVVSSVVSSVTSTYEMQEGLDATLSSLQNKLLTVQCAINAARKRRITDRDLLVLLASLIADVYRCNYYYRTFNRHNSHPLMIASEGTSDMTLSSSYRAAKRRRTIMTFIFGDKELNELYDALARLKSRDIGAFILMVNACPERPLKTYLYMDHNRLLNRDKERDGVMDFLFSPNTAGENNVDILPIVGPTGVGKTSLALHCLHDPKVKDHFSLKIFNKYNNGSIVGDKADPMADPIVRRSSIFEFILNGCNTNHIYNNDDNTRIAMLKQKLSSEKFLLVIDDIWIVDPKVWNALFDCLRCGEKGSKVILIFHDCHSHNKYKKFIVPRPVEPITIDRFSEEAYMLFFEEHAFGGADPEDYPELQKKGREIATRMNGSIWGAKIFGELLRDNLNTQFWSNFLQEGLLKKNNLRSDYNLFTIVEIIGYILPKRLPTKSRLGISFSPGGTRHEVEVKSYRELLVLDPNHCAPVDKNGEICLEFLLTKHIFLNECTVLTGRLYLK